MIRLPAVSKVACSARIPSTRASPCAVAPTCHPKDATKRFRNPPTPGPPGRICAASSRIDSAVRSVTAPGPPRLANRMFSFSRLSSSLSEYWIRFLISMPTAAIAVTTPKAMPPPPVVESRPKDATRRPHGPCAPSALAASSSTANRAGRRTIVGSRDSIRAKACVIRSPISAPAPAADVCNPRRLAAVFAGMSWPASVQRTARSTVLSGTRGLPQLGEWNGGTLRRRAAELQGADLDQLPHGRRFLAQDVLGVGHRQAGELAPDGTVESEGGVPIGVLARLSVA